jgi:hypothetical protein
VCYRQKNFLRKRQGNQEIQSTMRFGGNKNDNERLKWALSRESPMITACAPSKSSSTTRNKWVCKHDFRTGVSTAWSKTQTNSQSDFYEPHIDGYEVIGDVSAKRNVNKEISVRAFTSTVKNDPLKEDTLFTTKSIRSYKSMHGNFIKIYNLGAFSSIAPGMIRSQSAIQYPPLRNKLYSDPSIAFAIKVNNTENTLSKHSFVKSKNNKVAEIDVSDANLASLYNLEKMRHSQSKALEYIPKNTNVTKNVNYIHSQALNDDYILSRLSHAKMYYKSVQSKMVSPNVKKVCRKSLKNNVEQPDYQKYKTFNRGEIERSTTGVPNSVNSGDATP